jgi:hypothetical protein
MDSIAKLEVLEQKECKTVARLPLSSWFAPKSETESYQRDCGKSERRIIINLSSPPLLIDDEYSFRRNKIINYWSGRGGGEGLHCLRIPLSFHRFNP